MLKRPQLRTLQLEKPG